MRATDAHIDNWEKHARLGLEANDLQQEIVRWPNIDDCDESGIGFLAINNCIICFLRHDRCCCSDTLVWTPIVCAGQAVGGRRGSQDENFKAACGHRYPLCFNWNGGIKTRAVATSKSVAFGHNPAFMNRRENGYKPLICIDISHSVAVRKKATRLAVNRRVVGTNPTRGANHFSSTCSNPSDRFRRTSPIFHSDLSDFSLSGPNLSLASSSRRAPLTYASSRRRGRSLRSSERKRHRFSSPMDIAQSSFGPSIKHHTAVMSDEYPGLSCRQPPATQCNSPF